jgi:mRNA interferase MazF
LAPALGHEQAGKQPVVIISHDLFNERSGTVIALPITSQPRRVSLPLALKLESAKLPKPSWVKISQVRTLSTERPGRLSEEELDLVIEGLFQLVA